MNPGLQDTEARPSQEVMVFALGKDEHLAGGKANVQEGGKAMPSRRAAGKSALRATPRLHLQQISHLLQASGP